MTDDPTTDVATLTVYFAERERSGGRFLADALLDLFEHRAVHTSVLLRGIASFGPRNVVRSDRSLSLSEDPPVTVTAVDTSARLTALADEVAALTARGVITLDRGQIAATHRPAPGDWVRLTLYLGRKQRLENAPAHITVSAVLFRVGFAAAEVFLGVDGTVAGQRRRAHFFSRNTDVPLLVSGVGTAARAGAAIKELRALLPGALLTVERVEVCKIDGDVLAARPGATAPGYRKLTVRTAEDTCHQGRPVHRALIAQLKESRDVSGATTLRGIWGFRGTRQPRGDRFLQLARHVPVSTVVIDTAENIAAAYPIVDALTATAGLVTVEEVPAVLARSGGHSSGSLQLP